MPRHDHGQEFREESGERPVGFRQDFLFAGMRGGRNHHRAAACHRHQPLQLVGVSRRRGDVELEVSSDHDIAAAERCETIRVGLRLRQADLELAKQHRDGSRKALPAWKRALRHPAVDHHHRQPPRGTRQDQVRPQVRFDEHRQRGPPVIEESRDVARRIVRHILMDDVGGEPLGDDCGRGHRARGQEDAVAQRPQPLDQRRCRQHLADAGAVNPHQGTCGAGVDAHAAALADPCRVFLAELQPAADQCRRQRHHRGRQRPVDAQRHRQRISQERPPDARPPCRHDGSLHSDILLPEGAAFP